MALRTRARPRIQNISLYLRSQTFNPLTLMAFQFKIQLSAISRPPVWREVLVAETNTLKVDVDDIIEELRDL